jgi:thiamine biosynthesis lipoprotein
MGTQVNLTAVGDDRDAAEAAVAATFARMSQLESHLSRFRPDSEVSRLNDRGRIENASDDLIELLQLAERISGLGDGAFDVTVQPLLELYRTQLTNYHRLPTPEAIEAALERVGHRSVHVQGSSVSLARPGAAITIDGIGKGYIVDQGVAVLKAHGYPNVLVEAGGDLVAGGQRAPGKPWRIGIRRPRHGARSLQARVDASDRAVTTSGDYMQPFTPDFAQHHILDPRTGRSAPELASSTVIAPTAAEADGLSTLAMALGPRRSLQLLEDLPGCEGYLVTKDLQVVKTSGFVLS